jgi:8-oxo-dGTP diphosphatase
LPRIGLEPTHLTAPEPKSGVSTNFTTWARENVDEFYALSLFTARQICCKLNLMQKAAIAILQHPDDLKKILWVKRRHLKVWVLPGGGVDPGESYEDSALRELKEETGISGEITRKAAILHPVNSLAAETHLFICSCKQPEQLITSSEEAVDAGFFSIDSPPSPAFPLHVDWMKECLTHDFTERKIREITLPRVLLFFAQHPWLTLGYVWDRFKQLF